MTVTSHPELRRRDPQRRLYDVLDLPRRWWVGLDPKGWWNYVRAIALVDERATALRLHRVSAR